MKIPLALGFGFLMAGLAHADDWPQWLGPQRDGSTTERVKSWQQPLKIRWQQPVGEGHGAPVIAKGKVYLHFATPGKYEETIAAFDADAGKPLWNKSYERFPTKFLFGNGPRSSPAVVEGKVYTHGITGILSCYDADSGELAWQVDTIKEYKAPRLFFGASCSPVVEGDSVLINVGARGASVVAFDRNTGKEIWKKLDDGASYSSPIAIGSKENRQVIFLTAQGLVAISPRDGQVYWQYPFVDQLSESSTTPVVVGDLLFGSSITVGGIGLKMEGPSRSSVQKVWMNPVLNCYFSTPVAVGKDHLYLVTGTKPPAFSNTATLRCIEAATGKQLWKRDKVGQYHASLLRTGDDKILLVEEEGNLVLLDPSPKEYRALAHSKICGKTWAHPALANGRLYIRDENKLLCIDLPR